MPTPLFLPLLREAHAVYLANSLGLRTAGEIAGYAHISASKAAEWAKLLSIPLEPTPGCMFDHHYHLTNTPSKVQ